MITVLMRETRSAGASSVYAAGQKYELDNGTARLFMERGWATYISGTLVSNASLPTYWGPCTGRSSLPKASGVPKYTYGCYGQSHHDGGTRFRGVVALIHGPGERMQALADGTTNGYGDFKASMIYKGKCYPGFVVDSVNRFFEVTAQGVKVDDIGRIGRCMFGDILSLEFDTGNDFVPENSEVTIKIAAVQTGHNDAGAINANQYMCYGSRVRKGDVFAYGITGLSAANWQAWLDDVDSPVIPASLPGQAGNFIGMMFAGFCTLKTDPTKAIFGDSKNHGPSNEATGNSDQDFDMYGLTGEICNIIGHKHGCINVAMQTEKWSDITTTYPNGFKGRKKLAEMCTDGASAYPYNDLGDAGWTSELTTVATYQANLDLMRAMLPRMDRWFLCTISQAVTASNYIVDYAGQSSIRNARVVGLLNGAIRRGAFPQVDGYYDPAGALSETEDGWTFLVPPDAKTVNTGTGTITVNAADSNNPAITTLSLTAAPFTKRMEGYYIVIVGAGASAAVLRAQIQYVSTTDVRLIIRNSEDDPIAIPASMLNGGVSSLALTMSTNIAYIGAENYTVDSATSGAIHHNVRSYKLMRRYNEAMGLVK